MALTIKNLGIGAFTGAGNELVVVDAVGVSVLVNNIRITNSTAGALTYTLQIKTAGVTPRNLTSTNKSVPGFSSDVVRSITLSPGWQIVGNGGAGLHFVASGVQRN